MVWIRCIYGWDLEEAQQTRLTGMQAVRELEDFSDGDYSSGAQGLHYRYFLNLDGH
jgi:hypothetical protein